MPKLRGKESLKPGEDPKVLLCGKCNSKLGLTSITDHNKIKCANCGYERSEKDDEFISKDTCPKCGIMYNQFISKNEKFVSLLKITVKRNWLDITPGNELIEIYEQAQLIDERKNSSDTEFKTTIDALLDEIKKRGLKISIQKQEIPFEEEDRTEVKSSISEKVKQDEEFVSLLKSTVKESWLDITPGDELIEICKKAQLTDARRNSPDTEFKKAINALLDEIKKRGLYKTVKYENL
jgi:predicted  nucleic acid-binding Zn-ribbon protein